MDRPTFPVAAQNEIQFLLSLLNICSPGQPVQPHTDALQQLLPNTTVN